jgi:hypothetical protein
MSQVVTVPNSLLGPTFFRIKENWKALSLTQRVAILGTSILLTGAAITGFLNAAAITTSVASGITQACTAINTFCAGLNLATAATTLKYVAVGLGILGFLTFSITFFKKPQIQKNFEKLVHEKAQQLVLSDLGQKILEKTKRAKDKTQQIIAKGKVAGQAVCDGVKQSVETLSQTATAAKQGLSSITSRS